jgi:hypothetical protein
MNMVYKMLLIREATQSMLRININLFVDSIQDEQDQIDDFMQNEYPGWIIGCMMIESV